MMDVLLSRTSRSSFNVAERWCLKIGLGSGAKRGRDGVRAVFLIRESIAAPTPISQDDQ